MDIDNNQQNSSQTADDTLFEDDVTYKDLVQKDVLDLMGFTTLSQEKKDELHAKIERAIEDRVGARIYDALKEDERDQYQQLLDNSDWDGAKKFLTDREIDAERWLSEEALIMKTELYEDSRYLKNKVEESLKSDEVTEE